MNRYTVHMFAQTTTHTTLLARLGESGNRDAWDEFCARYGELIRGFARRQGLQPADCDDCLQDVLVKLTGAMPRFRYDPSRGKFRSYLKTVALHAIYEKSSRKKRPGQVVDIEQAANTAGNDPQVDEAWEVEWRRYHLQMAMKSIEMEFNRRDVTAFEAYAVRGESVSDVAEALGMSADQVYQAKSQILRRVSQLVAQQIEDEG